MTSTDTSTGTSPRDGELVHYDVAGPLATITLDSPHNKNALSRQLVTELAYDTIAASSGSGVTLIDDAGRRSAAATSQSPVQDADALQYELNEGPCLDAVWDRETVISDDLAHDPVVRDADDLVVDRQFIATLLGVLAQLGSHAGVCTPYCLRRHA